MLFVLLLLPVAATWIYWDASSNHIGKIEGVKGLANISAGAWGAGSGLLAIVFIPMYFLRRGDLILIAQDDPVESSNRPIKAAIIFIVVLVLLYVSLMGA